MDNLPARNASASVVRRQAFGHVDGDQAGGLNFPDPDLMPTLSSIPGLIGMGVEGKAVEDEPRQGREIKLEYDDYDVDYFADAKERR